MVTTPVSDVQADNWVNALLELRRHPAARIHGMTINSLLNRGLILPHIPAGYHLTDAGDEFVAQRLAGHDRRRGPAADAPPDFVIAAQQPAAPPALGTVEKSWLRSLRALDSKKHLVLGSARTKTLIGQGYIYMKDDGAFALTREGREFVALHASADVGEYQPPYTGDGKLNLDAEPRRKAQKPKSGKGNGSSNGHRAEPIRVEPAAQDAPPAAVSPASVAPADIILPSQPRAVGVLQRLARSRDAEIDVLREELASRLQQRVDDDTRLLSALDLDRRLP